jgi:hypothetical protein
VGDGWGEGDETPDEALARVGAELAAAVTAAVPRWVESRVVDLVAAWSGSVPAAVPPDVRDAARAAGSAAAADVGPDLARLLAADVDAQWTNPMSIVRRAVGHAAAVLDAAGVGPVRRSPEDEARLPEDRYDLTPRTFADVDPSLHELGIVWGAVKARAHLRRHRPGPAR